MSSVVDAFNEAFNEDYAYLKFFIYGIPVYISTILFKNGNMTAFTLWGSITGIIILSLLTNAINNVRHNRREILTLNPLKLLSTVFKICIAIIPQFVIFGSIASLIIKFVHIPIDLPQVPLIFSIIVWTVTGSIIATSYLNFSKKLNIFDAYDYRQIFDSCVDVFVGFLFFVPQIAVVNLILIIPAAYLTTYFHFSLNSWFFILYCSMVGIVNISISANYLAQASYETLKGKNDDYNDNYQIKLSVDQEDLKK